MGADAMSLAPSLPRSLVTPTPSLPRSSASLRCLWDRVALGRLTFPVVAILVTGLLSSLLGVLVARAAALLLVSDEPTVAHGRRLLPARPREKEAGLATGGDAALARNLFCHRCDSMAPPERKGSATRLDALGATALEASLVATVIPASGSANTREECPLSAASPGDMEWGAILRPVQGKNPLWVHRGSVLGQAEVTAVLADRVCYRLGEARGEWRWEGLREHATAVAGKVGEGDLAVRPSGPAQSHQPAHTWMSIQ